ncbi:RNA 2',3'-cyclic phosphodiesterase [Pontibacter sp. MBLB2868]|uniref:RNA 2',3'-cyclic phosphodiesterase n=1 Tax=Pontibacter sp. MBLB2868 TaxID=3451555 RepID=UPI003F755A98
MKDSIRLFVAATLPDLLIEKLEEQLQQFKHSNIRFMPVQNLHLTLYFIGNVPAEQLPAIKRTLQEVARHHQPFILSYAQTEPGPNSRKPRLIWARFATHKAFEALSQELTDTLAEKPTQPVKAIPHITLARFRKDKPAPPNLPAVSFPEPVHLQINAISLWQSELASPHPVYTVLETYALG